MKIVKTIFFRFDDICLNTDMKLVNDMCEFILEAVKNSKIILCLSPLVHDMSYEEGKHKQRIFPAILNAHSDYRLFFNVDHAGFPLPDLNSLKLNKNIILASHALVHVDHRLLTKSQQEMSILISCSLAKSKTFVPPFNKWNKDTELVCEENGIQLIKFEDGWLSMEHNQYNTEHDKWYLHSREFILEGFKGWFSNVKK